MSVATSPFCFVDTVALPFLMMKKVSPVAPSSITLSPSANTTSSSASSSLVMSEDERIEAREVPSNLIAERIFLLKFFDATSCSDVPNSFWKSAACSCTTAVSPSASTSAFRSRWLSSTSSLRADSPKHSFAANGNSSSEPRRLHTTFPSLMK